MNEPLGHSFQVAGFIVVGTGTCWELLAIPEAAIVRAEDKIVKSKNLHNHWIL